MASSPRFYLEPIVNGCNRIYLPDSKEMRLSSPMLYDKSFPINHQAKFVLSATARYEKSHVYIRFEGDARVYVDNEPRDPKEELIVWKGSVLEIHPGVLAFLLQFSEARKECVDLSPGPPEDQIAPKRRTYRWEVLTGGQLLTCTSGGFDCNRATVASFDLDGTLIKSKSGGYPKDSEDWTDWHEEVRPALYKLHAAGHKVVIFTNQAGVIKPQNSMSLPSFKKKIENVIGFLGIPVQVYIATFLGGPYRKPVPGMWRMMEWSSTVKPDYTSSFFVGDSAGRSQDRAASDRIFAENIGLRFYTPEEYFLNAPPEPKAPRRSPLGPLNDRVEMPDLRIPSDVQEAIVMVGPPSSGKTSFVSDYLVPNGNVPVSLDYFDLRDMSAPVLGNVLRMKRNVVLDDFNWTVADRRKICCLCKSFGVRLRCFVMEWSAKRCVHNSTFSRMFDIRCPVLLPSELRRYEETFEMPSFSEGFHSIQCIPFIPRFKCDNLQSLYNCYLHPN